ncbi:MAG: peptidylprolyl isomerase [Planctomycetota bacterium]|nr:MAG: peptidylprolyl isomerase [Planctomycetota bacterium]
MNEFRYFARIAAVMLGLGAALCAAQDALVLQDAADSGVLRAEVTSTRRVFRPGDPILIRLTLRNPTSEVIELPLPNGRADAEPLVGLPRTLVYGEPDAPGLWLSLDDDKPAPLAAPASDEADGDIPASLRIAPRASVGVEIDISRLSRQLRYSGVHRLEWRPPVAGVAPAAATFRIEPRKRAVLVTDYGKITFDLFYEQAPQNVENLLDLIRSQFYNGLTLHRIIPGFIIQGGSPDGTGGGTRPDGRTVPAEFHEAPFEAGTLAMARKPADPDSASCQFFIALTRLPDLDGQYTVVGQARDDESLLTLRQLANLPADENGRPLRPVVIRSFTLIDAP